MDVLAGLGPSGTSSFNASDGWERSIGGQVVSASDNVALDDAFPSGRLLVTERKSSENDSEVVVYRMNHPSAPDANSILRLLGPWLFDATLNRTNEFAVGKAQAIRRLGRILCDHGGGNSKALSRPHASRFLNMIIANLEEKENDDVTVAILYGCNGIFGSNSVSTLCGNGIVASHYYAAIDRVLQKTMYATIELNTNGM